MSLNYGKYSVNKYLCKNHYVISKLLKKQYSTIFNCYLLVAYIFTRNVF